MIRSCCCTPLSTSGQVARLESCPFASHPCLFLISTSCEPAWTRGPPGNWTDFELRGYFRTSETFLGQHTDRRRSLLACMIGSSHSAQIARVFSDSCRCMWLLHLYWYSRATVHMILNWRSVLMHTLVCLIPRARSKCEQRPGLDDVMNSRVRRASVNAFSHRQHIRRPRLPLDTNRLESCSLFHTCGSYSVLFGEDHDAPRCNAVGTRGTYLLRL